MVVTVVLWPSGLRVSVGDVGAGGWLISVSVVADSEEIWVSVVLLDPRLC